MARKKIYINDQIQKLSNILLNLREDQEKKQLVYSPEDKPKIKDLILLAFQHLVVCFPATTLITLTLAAIIGLPGADTAKLLTAMWLVMGIGTIFQATIGTRLPIVVGHSASYLGQVAAAVFLVMKFNLTNSPAVALSYIAPALIVAGLIQVGLGYLKISKIFKRFLTPIPIGTIVFLIGASLFWFPASLVGSQTNPLVTLLLALLAIGFVVFLALSKQKLFKFGSIVWVFIGGSLLAFVLHFLGYFHVDYSTFTNASFFSLPTPFPWGLNFSSKLFPIILFMMFIGVVITIFENLGDFITTSLFSHAPLDDKKIDDGIKSQGWTTALCGIFGSSGMTTYSENVGTVGLTKAASRFITLLAGALMVLLAFSPKLASLFSLVPSPVIGGAAFVLFGLIALIGIKVLGFVPMTARNMLIIGLSISIALGFHVSTTALDQDNIVIGTFESIDDILGTHLGDFGNQLSSLIKLIFTTPIIIGGIMVVLLDNLIPGSRDERGLDIYKNINKL